MRTNKKDILLNMRMDRKNICDLLTPKSPKGDFWKSATYIKAPLGVWGKIKLSKQPIIINVFLLLFSISLSAEEWQVPEANKKQTATFKFTDESIKIGEDLYNRNCASCHGNPGKANYVKLNPLPGDPASAVYQKNTDGAMYYKITEGRGAMLSFKNTLEPEQRWQIISYIRSYNKNYVQPEVAEINLSPYAGKVRVNAEFNSDSNILSVKLGLIKGTSTEAIADANVSVFVKRNFGNLKVDKSKITDKEGIALFKIPNNIPGDSGMIQFRINILNESINLTYKHDTLIKAGIDKQYVKQLDERAMWNKSSKAPMWLIISYILGVLGVWAVIISIVLKIKKMSYTKSLKDE